MRQAFQSDNTHVSPTRWSLLQAYAGNVPMPLSSPVKIILGQDLTSNGIRTANLDLPDELWTKISIEFYKDPADAVFKALME